MLAYWMVSVWPPEQLIQWLASHLAGQENFLLVSGWATLLDRAQKGPAVSVFEPPFLAIPDVPQIWLDFHPSFQFTYTVCNLKNVVY